MVSVKGTRISMTRGDTCRIKLDLSDDLSEEYIPSDEDVIRFAVKKNYTDSEPLIFKVIPNDTLVLTIDPSDTKELAFGSYVYDIQITFANGDVDTFITKASLKIEEEVD